MAAGYPVPVHYEDKETGEFLEINNDLEKTAIDGEAYYTNADNPFEVSLPENLSAGQPIIVSQDENSIGLTYLPNEDGHVEAAADSGILAAPPQKPAASASPGGNIQITNRVGAVKTLFLENPVCELVCSPKWKIRSARGRKGTENGKIRRIAIRSPGTGRRKMRRNDERDERQASARIQR